MKKKDEIKKLKRKEIKKKRIKTLCKLCHKRKNKIDN